MEIKSSTTGSGIISMVPTVDDYLKTLKELYNQVSDTPFVTGDEYLQQLSEAQLLLQACKSGQIVCDFSMEEKIKSCIFSTRDWLAAKNRTSKFDIFHALYQWKLEKFQDRAWDASMVAENCEGILFRLMERISNETQNIAVVQVFLSVQELESSNDSSVRIETRLKDGLQKLKKMIEDNVPLVGVTRAN